MKIQLSKLTLISFPILLIIGGSRIIAQTDYDCFIGEYGGNLNFYERQNSGAGSTSFSVVTGGSNPLNGVVIGSGGGYNSTPAFVDIDNDGDQDFFSGEYYGEIEYYENTGNGGSATFTERTGGSNPFNGVDVGSGEAESDPTFVDIDGDGDQDCFIGEYDGTINYYKNEGNSSSPTFTLTTGGSNPFNGVDVGYDASPTFVNIDGDASLPVELTSFTVISDRSNAITLQWITESETNNLGFIVDRRTQDLDWIEIASFLTHPELQGQGSVTHQTVYTFTDNTISMGEIYDYQLADVDYYGNTKYHNMIVVGVSPFESILNSFSLYSAYPNPFNPITTLRYKLSSSTFVTLIVYDMLGREISQLVKANQNAGLRLVQWDGTDSMGRPVSAGAYLYQINAGEFVQTKKIVLLK